MVNNAKRFNPSYAPAFQAADTLWSAWKKKRVVFFTKIYGNIPSTSASTGGQLHPPQTIANQKVKADSEARYISKVLTSEIEQSPSTLASKPPTKQEPRVAPTRVSQLDALLQRPPHEGDIAKVNSADDLPPMAAEGKLLTALTLLKDPSVQALLRSLLMSRLDKLLSEDKLPANDIVVRRTIQLLHISVEKYPRIPGCSDLILRRCLPSLMEGVATSRETKVIFENLDMLVKSEAETQGDSSLAAILEVLKAVTSLWLSSKSLVTQTSSTFKTTAKALSET